MIIHNKLVRDRIPEIIEKSGKTAYCRILNNEEYIEELLNEKASKRVTKTMFSDVKIFLKTINQISHLS